MQSKYPLDERFIAGLREALGNGLPGRGAQFDMAPSGRLAEQPNELTPAGVLIALFPRVGAWHFPLIHRVDDGFPHGGQISLPGGRLEPGESVEQGAIREANEEVGLSPESLDVLGALTPLPIPVSGYTATAVVATVSETPRFTIQPSEVQAVLLPSLDELVSPANQRSEMRSFNRQERAIPYFMLEGHKVWGATAMILAEFKDLLQKLPF